MDTIKYSLIVDLARPTKTNIIQIPQNDAGTRELFFKLLSDGEDYDTTGVSFATYSAVTPSSTTVTGDVTIVKDANNKNTNELTFALPSSITSESGIANILITLNSESQRLSSFVFHIATKADLYNTSEVNADDLSGFRDLLNQAVDAVAKVNALNAKTSYPCEYPLRCTIGGTLYSYNGSERIDIPTENIENSISHMKAITEVSLTADGWTGSAAPYSQAVAVTGCTADSAPTLLSRVNSTMDLATQKAYMKAYGYVCEGYAVTSDGTVTFYAYKKPAATITVGLKGVQNG